jgi:hypothetical protein
MGRTRLWSLHPKELASAAPIRTILFREVLSGICGKANMGWAADKRHPSAVWRVG